MAIRSNAQKRHFLARFSVLAYNYTIFTRNALKSKILQK